MSPRARILERSAGVAYWTMLIMAVWILLRGHNAPGGGFIAGLVALSATAQLSIVRGSAAARRYLPARLAAWLQAVFCWLSPAVCRRCGCMHRF